MGCAAALQPSFVQRGLLDLRGAGFVDVGVLEPDVAADETGCAAEVASVVVVMSEDSGSWLLRNDGAKRFRVEDSSSLRSPTVVEGSSCLPPKTSLDSAGNVVEAERNSRTLATVWVGLTFSGMPGD